MFLRALVVWLGLALLAVTNGAVRESAIVPRLGAVRGGQLSAILLAVGILLITHFTITWIAPARRRDAWLVGFTWLLLVLLFEASLGRARGTSPTAMLEEYKFWTGRPWVLVLLATATAPFLTGRLRRLI